MAAVGDAATDDAETDDAETDAAETDDDGCVIGTGTPVVDAVGCADDMPVAVTLLLWLLCPLPVRAPPRLKERLPPKPINPRKDSPSLR